MSSLLLNFRIASLAVGFGVALHAADATGGLPKESPFKLRGGPAAPAASVSETIEFAGVSSIGKKTDLIFYDKTTKKSHWITPGETKEGIAVINYDEGREEAVVKINGVQKTLALRKPSGPVGTARAVAHQPSGFNTPAPVALPSPVAVQPATENFPAAANTAGPAANAGDSAAQANAAPSTPAQVQQKQETEARMLVSDLLEIGMAQRRAYEEAQRKAAQGNSPGTPAEANQAPDPTTQAPR
jgi:hypothetical protein